MLFVSRKKTSNWYYRREQIKTTETRQERRRKEKKEKPTKFREIALRTTIHIDFDCSAMVN